jgi:sulfur relay (sulfurtransferase) DsrC/TusE family protein
MKKIYNYNHKFSHLKTIVAGLILCSFLLGLTLGIHLPNMNLLSIFDSEPEFYLEKDMTDAFDHLDEKKDESDKKEIKNQTDNKIMSASNMVDYIAYRIYYVRDFYNKYNNSNVKPVSKETARKWANQIVYHSLVREDRNISPLMIAAILETETNFIPGYYDSGQSLGIHSMQITTAKEIAHELGEDYSREEHMDPLGQGIRYMTYYIHKAQYKYDNVFNVITSYNKGYAGSSSLNKNEAKNFYYTKRVKSRWDDYISHMMNDIDDFENIEMYMDLNYQ